MDLKVPIDFKRAAKLTLDIWLLYLKNKPYNDYRHFTNFGNPNSESATHRLRLFHDQLFLDSWKNNCDGTIYRSNESMHLANRAGQVHCEHIIPINVLIKFIYYQLNPLSLIDLGKFIFDNSLVCCVTKKEQISKLNTIRSINGIQSKWTLSHPQLSDLDGSPYENGKQLQLADILPFKRYIGTDMHIYSVYQNKIIDPSQFRISDHWKIIEDNQNDSRLKFIRALEKLK